MTDIVTRDGAWGALHDPATTSTALASIAAAHPEFAPQIAAHQNAYPQLIAWANAVSVPAAPQMPTPVAHPSPSNDRTEGTAQAFSVLGRRLWMVSGALIALGAIAWVFLFDMFEVLMYTSGDTVWSVVSLIGIGITGLLPIVAAGVSGRTGGRKVGGILTAAAGFVWLMLLIFPAVMSYGIYGSMVSFLPFPGTRFGVFGLVYSLIWMALLFVSWALTWPVRGVGYLGMIPLFIASAGGAFTMGMFYGGPGDIVISLITAIVLPAVAVMMALMLTRSKNRKPLPTPRPATVGGVGVVSSHTNTMAVLSLVFAFVFALLGVIFGHIALSQIRQTGEQGRGLAIAGVTIGYVALGLGLVLVIGQFALYASLMSGYGY